MRKASSMHCCVDSADEAIVLIRIHHVAVIRARQNTPLDLKTRKIAEPSHSFTVFLSIGRFALNIFLGQIVYLEAWLRHRRRLFGIDRAVLRFPSAFYDTE